MQPRQGEAADRARRELLVQGVAPRAAELQARAAADKADARTHDWEGGGATLYRTCRRCLRGWFRRAPVPPCGGVAPKLARLVAVARYQGHSLSHWPNPRRAKLLACAGCGAWTEAARARKLLLPCAPPTASGRCALARLRRGRHPTGKSASARYRTLVRRPVPAEGAAARGGAA